MNALGEGDDVGLETVEAAGEPLPRATEARDHLVDDREHVVLAADLLHSRPVVGGRHQHPARARDGLADEGGDGLRPFPFDHRVELGHLPVAEGLLALARAGEAEGVRAGEMDRARQRQVEGLVVDRDAGEAAGGEREAVTTAVAAQDLLLFGLAAQIVVVADEFDVRVVGVRTRGAKEHLGKAAHAGLLAEQRQHSVGEPDHGLVRGRAEQVVVGELLDRGARRLGDLRPTVADVDAPEAGAAVDVILAPMVADPHALALPDDGRALREMLDDRGVGMEQARLVHPLERPVGRRLEDGNLPQRARLGPVNRCGLARGAGAPPAGPLRAGHRVPRYGRAGLRRIRHRL